MRPTFTFIASLAARPAHLMVALPLALAAAATAFAVEPPASGTAEAATATTAGSGIASSAATDPAKGSTPPPACPDGTRLLGGGRFRLADGSATVALAPYCLEAVEVTASGYAACVAAGACRAEALACSNAATYARKGKEDHPVNCVSWHEADDYCRWRQRRLPTEGEWEWAARGQAAGSRYPWGTAAPAQRACWDGKGNGAGASGRSGPCPVASHPGGASPDGLQDLAGNVREWTASGEGRERVVRGGSWGDSLDWFLAAGFRGFNHPSERFELTGFRCAVDAPARDGTPRSTTASR